MSFPLASPPSRKRFEDCWIHQWYSVSPAEPITIRPKVGPTTACVQKLSLTLLLHWRSVPVLLVSASVQVTLLLRWPPRGFIAGHLQRHPQALQQQGEHGQAQTEHQAATRGQTRQRWTCKQIPWHVAVIEKITNSNAIIMNVIFNYIKVCFLKY